MHHTNVNLRIMLLVKSVFEKIHIPAWDFNPSLIDKVYFSRLSINASHVKLKVSQSTSFFLLLSFNFLLNPWGVH